MSKGEDRTLTYLTSACGRALGYHRRALCVITAAIWSLLILGLVTRIALMVTSQLYEARVYIRRVP